MTGPDYRSRRIAVRATFVLLLIMSGLFGAMCGLTVVYSVDLPQMADLAKYRPNTTTELLDVNGKVIGSFALERRVVVPYSALPQVLQDAIISIEDKSFESNWGVNLIRAVGAAYRDLHTKGKGQGASTLTMQLARNLFLSSQKTYGRKLQEVLLSVQIERRFTKPQIFTFYANQIYLGHGTYGFEAGSEFYFSKHVKDLTLPEAALLAALPKGPEAYSPIKYPDRAMKRRNLVLSEMLADGKITAAQAAAAQATTLGLKIEPPPNSVAPYFVEEVRRQLEKEYGVDEVHGAGLRVYTTLDLNLQMVANKAVLDGTAAYERRHGWKGNLQNVVLAGLDPEIYRHPDWFQPVVKGSYLHGMVTQVTANRVVVKVGTVLAVMGPEDWKWTGNKDADEFLKNGDLVYVRIEEAPAIAEGVAKASLQQDSGVQASMMAIDNANGEVLAMVGGRDFALSQFNRATQSQRQVGSSFKPYVYTAAVEAGTKPTDIIVDAPVSFWTPNGYYTPHNYEPDWKGAMSITLAFAESRNIPALKLADHVGIRKVIEVAHRFGITSNMPAFLPIAIGAADITLAEQVGAYAVFPNDGIRIEPHYIKRVTQADGTPLDVKPTEVKEVISVDTARTMMTLLRAVTSFGTAAAVAPLKHPFGGKTGTTNDFTDAWFVGFSPSVTCGTWIGFDDRTSLGSKETGAKAALPMWMDFMKEAIKGKPDEIFPTGDMPKKQLEVAVTPAGAAPAVAAKAAAKEKEEDPDIGDVDDTGGPPKPAAKPAIPVAPVTPIKPPVDLPQDGPAEATPSVKPVKPIVVPTKPEAPPVAIEPVKPPGGAN
ncbi:penicillin-binding protein 1A [Granulicella rosea]|nr:PBP1A family penicillin-binding protein [Granulicella rosea]